MKATKPMLEKKITPGLIIATYPQVLSHCRKYNQRARSPNKFRRGRKKVEKWIKVQYLLFREYDEKVRIFLQKLQSHPNHVNILNELSVDTSIFEQENSIKREMEMLCNRLELTFKQVESALAIAKLEMHSSN